MTDYSDDPNLAFVEALRVVPAMARLWYELLTNCIAEGMTPDQALKVVTAYVHGQAGGKLQS